MKDLEERGVIRENISQWRNPIRFLETPDGTLRLGSNLSFLNGIVRNDPQTIPIMRNIINAISGGLKRGILLYTNRGKPPTQDRI